MFHTKKFENSPITLEELKRMDKRDSHGMSIWRDEEDGSRSPLLFDGPTGTLLNVAEFKGLQRKHAVQRRANYPTGRRKSLRLPRNPYDGMGWDC